MGETPRSDVGVGQRSVPARFGTRRTQVQREHKGDTDPREEPEGAMLGVEPARRALVVDDDDETREYLRDLLALSGFEVEAAADAAGARVLLARRLPHVMLIDIMMPRESGMSLLRDLRAREVHIPALFVTARDGRLPDNWGRELGAVVVRKPFRAGDLLDAVTRACARVTF
jgi:CheY-like chemotaxis protein